MLLRYLNNLNNQFRHLFDDTKDTKELNVEKGKRYRNEF